MTVEAIAQDHSNARGSLMESVVYGEMALARLSDVDELRRAAQFIISAANANGCTQLEACSQQAELLTIAALLLAPGQLERVNHTEKRDARVMIVEAVSVSGTNVRSAADELSDAGAKWIGAVIYDRVRPDLDDLDTHDSVQIINVVSRT